MTNRIHPLALLVSSLVCGGSAAGQESTPPIWPLAPILAQNDDGSVPAGAGVTGSDGQPIEEVTVVGRLKSSAFDVVSERLEEDVVSDFLGAEAIARVGDSTVSLALRRVPGLTVVNNQYVYVRGLGERYSSVLLNGAQVPSPDLTRNVIPLDIFPTEIIQALAVQKGYAPDMPAAFGGGNVDIITRGIPNGSIVNVQVGSGFNSDAGSDGYSYRGGRDDGLGRDDGTRAFPTVLALGLQQYRGNVSAARILDTLNAGGGVHTVDEALSLNRDLAASLYRDVGITKKALSPDGSLEASLGNRWYFGSEERWEFGALGLFSYDNSWRNRERVARDIADPITLVENRLRTINQVAATGAVNLGVKFGDDHEVSTSSFLLRNTEDESSIATRTNNNFQRSDGRQLRDYDIRYEQRELTASQLRGHHVVGADTRDLLPWLDHAAFGGLTFDWYTSDATAVTDIPSEMRFSAEDIVDRATGALLSTSIRRSNSAADYRFTALEDHVRSNGWDLTKPLTFNHVDVEIAGGQDVSDKARTYTQTQFGLGTTVLAAVPILAGTPEQAFTDANIRNPAYGFALSAGGIGTESYLAAQASDAAYLKADALVREKWRFAGGIRWEQFRQVSLPLDTLQYDVSRGQCALSPCDPAALERIAFFEEDTYPSISVTRIMHDVWADDFQLRFGMSQTVARPDLREVSASAYIDPLTETRVRGNPDLVTSPIKNFDARAEWFFSNGDNFTVSLFRKNIERPIETVQGAGTDDNISLTFVNAKKADISGLELEWLKDLSSLGAKFLEPLFFSGNVTVSDSELQVGDVGFNVTNDVRPMAQHSKYVANLQLGFDSDNGKHAFTLAYNTFGKRLFFAGRDGAPDAYEQPFDSLDFVYSLYPSAHLSVKFRVQNLLGEQLEIQQRGTKVIEQNVGATVKIDIKWHLGS